MAFPQNGAKVFAMRHRKRIDRLGRPADQRKALVRGLVTEVLRHGRITTTKVHPDRASCVHFLLGFFTSLLSAQRMEHALSSHNRKI